MWTGSGIVSDDLRYDAHSPCDRLDSDMSKLFLHHPVADFDTWRPVFDGDAPRRESAGLTNVRVLRDVDDPSSVWLVADGDPTKMEEMLGDPELGEAMQRAGVTAPPELFVAD